MYICSIVQSVFVNVVCPLLLAFRMSSPPPYLGCAFRFISRFLTGLIFRNPQISADYFRFRGTHARIKSFQGKINLFRNPPESRNPEGFCATCNEHSLRRHEENRCQRWHSAVSCCCYRAPPQTAMPCCRHCCHCLIRGSSGGAADVAACSGGSGSSSGAAAAAAAAAQSSSSLFS